MPSTPPNIILVKTPAGRAEMTERAQGLSMLERRLLILSDGTRTLAQLQTMLNMPVDAMVQRLQSMGLLISSGGSAQNSAAPGLRSAMPAKFAAPVSSPSATAFANTSPSGYFGVAQQNAGFEEADAGILASEDELASDFSEQLSVDSASEFERESSRFQNSNSHLQQSDPSSTLQRAITSRGISLGKAYLINISSRLLDSRDAALLRSITQIKTEGDLYHQFELVIDTISTRLGSVAINEILEQFDEQINQG